MEIRNEAKQKAQKLGCSYPDCICQGDEIIYCNNRTPEQVVLGDKTALVENIFHQELKKTPIQELIDEIVEHLTYDDDLSDDSRITLETIRLRCLGKLTKEKEQIINTFKHAQVLHAVNDQMRGEQYYNETYGSKDNQFKCKYCARPMDVNFLEYRSNSFCNVCFDERAASKPIAKSRLNTFEFMDDVIPLEQEPSQTTSDKWKEYQDWLNEVPELSDEEINKWAKEYLFKEYGRLIFDCENYDTYNDFVNGAKKYREQLKIK